MTKVTLLTFTVFLTLALYFNSVLATSSDDFTVDGKRRDGDKKYSTLWFGPRIGRRKRNPSENVFKALDRDEIEALAGGLKNSPWPLTFNNGKRQMDFTPRLGREFIDEDDELDYDDFKHKPLTPRVGRRFSPYSPRLGRENEILLQ